MFILAGKASEREKGKERERERVCEQVLDVDAEGKEGIAFGDFQESVEANEGRVLRGGKKKRERERECVCV